VLTDLRMPGMTGLELQAALAARHIEVPLVVLTAHGDVSTARAALKNGAFDFLEKPVDDAQLVEVLPNALLAAGHQNREIATQLEISPRTVEVHRARIMEKLECHSLAELIPAHLPAG